MLMSKSAYAKHRGVSRQTVYDWIDKGEVAMSGSKIDVTATEQRQPVEPERNGEDNDNPYPERTLEMTWREFWEAVKSNDGKRPLPVAEEEIQQKVKLAARELNWGIEFLADGGVFLDDGDATHYFQEECKLEINARNAINLLRSEVCYVADDCPDELDEWSEEGMLALSK